jgi:hypothetical protein
LRSINFKGISFRVWLKSHATVAITILTDDDWHSSVQQEQWSLQLECRQHCRYMQLAILLKLKRSHGVPLLQVEQWPKHVDLIRQATQASTVKQHDRCHCMTAVA